MAKSITSTMFAHVISGIVVPSALALSLVAIPAQASDRDEAYHQDYIFGVPVDPTEAWSLANGARLYDNWINALGVDKPDVTHPAWPASNTKKKGGVTWRCKSCHGWDYAGADGAYASGSYKTGITGVRAFAGRDPGEVHKVMMDETHGFTHEMIPKDAMLRLATFVSAGQIDAATYINADKSVNGDPQRGAAVFQNICAACHGFDGRALDWGNDEKSKFIGTEAQSNPWEVLHKIRAGHPGVEMPALMGFPIEDAIDLLSYTQTLPAK